jgi:hypothetical protein
MKKFYERGETEILSERPKSAALQEVSKTTERTLRGYEELDMIRNGRVKSLIKSEARPKVF